MYYYNYFDMALVNCSTIDVETEAGTSRISLCVGSVTKCPQKVDVLVVSAFPGIFYNLKK